MRVDEFDFVLPEELIAQEPLEDRTASRMLLLDRRTQSWEDRRFSEFPQFVREGDCLILNQSKVIPSRLFARRASGGARIEVFLVRPLEAEARTWSALVRPGKRVKAGETLILDDGSELMITDRGERGERTVEFQGTPDVYALLDRLGHVPLPPYIRRPDVEADRGRYQTVFARERGSVAAPTAGLHFTEETLRACDHRGARIAKVTLHVGLGTFAPLEAETVEQNRLHSERYSITPEAMEAVRSAGRRIAVGTTSVRAIESAYATGMLEGETSIFIYPGYRFRAVDALLTNFHLPKSSLLMLVSALAGREFALEAYAHAVKERYRFFSYGDCMLVL